MKASKPRGARAGKAGGNKPQQSKAKSTASDPARPVEFRPLKPQRAWFIVLSIAFAVWVGIMLTIYFREIRPERNLSPSTAPIPATEMIR